MCWWGIFFRRVFWWIFPLSDMDINYQMVQTNSQLMLLVELLRKSKGYQHLQSYFTNIFGIWMNFYSFSTPHFTFFLQSTLLLFVVINLSYSLWRLGQILFYLTWLSYPCLCHGLFATTHRNRFLIILSPFWCCILLVTLYLKYQFSYPFCAIFYPYPHHNFILLFSSPPRCLLLLVYFPCWYHFTYPCLNRIFNFLISLCLSLL